MNPHRRDATWEAVARAARAGEYPRAAAGTAPEDFVARVRAMHDGLWQVAKMLLWRRWSLLLAAFAVIVYLILHFAMPQPAEPAVPRPAAPKLEIP